METKRIAVLFCHWLGVVFAAGIALTACTGPQGPAALAADPEVAGRTGLEGAWVLQANQALLPDGKLVPRKTYESLWLFTSKHYSITFTRGEQPREPLSERGQRTEEEKAAAFQSIVVNAGTYELNGSELTTHPTVARFPSFVGGRAEFECRLDGDTMFLQRRRSFNAEGKPYQEEGQEFTFALKRIE